MANAWKITSANLVGAQPIDETSTTQRHPLGTIVTANSETYGAGEFVYLLGIANTAVVQKYDASANAAVVLTDAVDLLTATQVAREGYVIELLSTLSQAQRTLDVGDTLEVKVTAASTVTGQPTDFFVTAELLVAE